MDGLSPEKGRGPVGAGGDVGDDDAPKDLVLVWALLAGVVPVREGGGSLALLLSSHCKP